MLIDITVQSYFAFYPIRSMVAMSVICPRTLGACTMFCSLFMDIGCSNIWFKIFRRSDVRNKTFFFPLHSQYAGADLNESE